MYLNGQNYLITIQETLRQIFGSVLADPFLILQFTFTVEIHSLFLQDFSCCSRILTS